MAKVAGVRGIERLTDSIVEAGCEALKKFTKRAKEDKVESDLHFEAKQTLTGKYAIGDKGEVGIVLNANAPAAGTVGGDASANLSLEDYQEGAADVTLSIMLRITARDRSKKKEKKEEE